MITKLIQWFKKSGNGQSKLGRLAYNRKLKDISYQEARWRFEPMFVWYDFWIGVYIDTKKEHAIYVMILPCCGFKFYYG